MLVPVLKMGTPSLLERSVEIATDEFNSPELLNLIQDLIDTQQHHGGVGIAAPQIGVNKRVLIIEYAQTEISRYADIGNCQRKVIINPQLTVLNEVRCSFNEGCLSLPGLRGEVVRAQTIKYQYYDQFGSLHQGEDDGFFARVMQHECDHLDGILYTMRMHDISKLSFLDLS